MTGYCSLLKAALRLHALFATPVMMCRGSGRQVYLSIRKLLLCQKHNLSAGRKIVFSVKYNLTLERKPAGLHPGCPQTGVANSELERSVLSGEQYPVCGRPGVHRSRIFFPV